MSEVKVRSPRPFVGLNLAKTKSLLNNGSQGEHSYEREPVCSSLFFPYFCYSILYDGNMDNCLLLIHMAAGTALPASAGRERCTVTHFDNLLL